MFTSLQCCSFKSSYAINFVPGVASKLAFRVPGSAGTAGLEPSMDSFSAELVLEIPDFFSFFLCRAFWIDGASEGRLASWWKTFRLRMMAYTRLQLPVRKIFRQIFSYRHHNGLQGVILLSSRHCSHHQTDTGWCCWRPPAERRPDGGSVRRRRGTRVWWRPPGDGGACWQPPWTGSSDKGKL